MRPAWRRLLAAAMLTLIAGGAAANGWSDFYTGGGRATASDRAPSGGAAHPDLGICISEILAAQHRHGIPGNLLLAIGLQEAGLMKAGELTVWPYAVNSEGAGYHFETRQAALDFVYREQRQGVESMDLGCMQINLRWHPEAFVTPAEGFDPRINVDYAARFLKRLYRETGDWQAAAGAYHSRTPDKQAVYRSGVLRNVRVANQRIADFHALAEAAGAAPRRASVRSAGGAFWSTRASGDGPRTSLYGGAAIQPLLPNLRRGD